MWGNRWAKLRYERGATPPCSPPRPPQTPSPSPPAPMSPPLLLLLLPLPPLVPPPLRLLVRKRLTPFSLLVPPPRALPSPGQPELPPVHYHFRPCPALFPLLHPARPQRFRGSSPPSCHAIGHKAGEGGTRLCASPLWDLIYEDRQGDSCSFLRIFSLMPYRWVASRIL